MGESLPLLHSIPLRKLGTALRGTDYGREDTLTSCPPHNLPDLRSDILAFQANTNDDHKNDNQHDQGSPREQHTVGGIRVGER